MNFENLNTEFVRTRVMKKGVNTDTLTFENDGAKLKDYENCVLNVDGFFITTDGYGRKQVVVVADNHLINMPARAVGQFEAILGDELLCGMVEKGLLQIVVDKITKCRQGTTVLYDLKTKE